MSLSASVDGNNVPNGSNIADNQIQSDSEININLILKLLPDFDGKPDELSNFIDRVNDAFELASECQKSILLTFVKAKLQGNARVPLRNQHFGSWTELKTKLIEVYGDKKSFAQAQLELQNTRQFKNEQVSAFTQRIETKVQRLLNILNVDNSGGGVAESQVDLIKRMGLTAFIHGALPQYGLLLRARDPESVQAASRIAQNEEIALKFQSVSINNNNHFQSSRTNYFGNNSAVNKQNPKEGPNYSRGSNFQNQSNQNRGQNSQDQSNQFSGARQLSGVSKIVCRYCKKPGHEISVCRKLAFKKSQENQQKEKEVVDTTVGLNETFLNNSFLGGIPGQSEWKPFPM